MAQAGGQGARGPPPPSAGPMGAVEALPWTTCQPTRRCQVALRLARPPMEAPQMGALRGTPSRSTTPAVAPVAVASHLHPQANSLNRLKAEDHTHLQVSIGKVSVEKSRKFFI